jgi:hypothetical protein
MRRASFVTGCAFSASALASISRALSKCVIAGCLPFFIGAIAPFTTAAGSFSARPDDIAYRKIGRGLEPYATRQAQPRPQIRLPLRRFCLCAIPIVASEMPAAMRSYPIVFIGPEKFRWSSPGCARMRTLRRAGRLMERAALRSGLCPPLPIRDG